MTGLTTSDDPPFLPVALTSKNRFIKVKRKADEHPLPLLVLEEGDHTCLYLLSSSTSEDTNFSSRQPIAIDTFLSELKVLILEGKSSPLSL